MRAILINPYNETIKEVVYTGDYREIYVLTECKTFDCVNIDDDNSLFVDDEGLFTQSRYFSWNGRNFAGKGIVIGVDYQTGEDMETSLTIEDVTKAVEFLPEGHRETPYMEFKAWS